MKTLAIRLHDEQHARLALVAKVTGETVTELIRSAIDERLTTLMADASLAAKATTVLEALDRQAKADRDAIAGLISSTPAAEKSSRNRAKTSPA